MQPAIISYEQPNNKCVCMNIGTKEKKMGAKMLPAIIGLIQPNIQRVCKVVELQSSLG
jgi:hypothetical protein